MATEVHEGDLILVTHEDGQYFVDTEADIAQMVRDDIMLDVEREFFVADAEFCAAYAAYQLARRRFVQAIHSLQVAP